MPTQKSQSSFLDINQKNSDFKMEVKYSTELKGLSEEVVKKISEIKGEPEWMLKLRLKAFAHFTKRAMPTWGPDLSAMNFDEITYYRKPDAKNAKDWKDVPENIKKTFERLGIPEAERNFLAGAGAQMESESIYHKVRDDLAKLGVIFCDMDTAVREHPEIVKKYFGTVVPYNDNKFASLNTAVWSGGSFVYIPKGVHVELPLQAYFRINAERTGQFERTMIIVEDGASVHYIEGCFTKGAPVITADGIKPIEEVKVGDFVLTHNNRFKKVYHVQVRPHTGKLFTIKYFGDSTQKIEATGEHPFLAVKRQKHECKNTEWKPDWVKAEELEKEDYLAIPIDRKVEALEERIFPIEKGTGRHGFRTIEFKIKTDSDFFRLAGYYLAEGSIVGGHYVHFTFNEREKPHIDDVKELLKKYFGKEPWEQKPYKHGISLVLSSTAAARFFETQFSKGAAGKRIPDWVMKESPEKQKELVKGFWRGDGSFMIKQYSYGVKRMFRMNTISKNLAESLQKMLLRMNIFASLNKHKRTGKRKDIYCVHSGGSFLKAFADVVGAYPSTEVAMGRQIAFQMLQQINAKSFAHITENYAFVPIREIISNDVENIPVYNFSVEEDESYVAHGVAVHNCSAPSYSENSLHAAVVELIALPGSRVRYTTLQNWATNIFNLVTKRAHAHEGAYVEWVDANVGCLTGDTKIFLNSNVKNISEVGDGDVVFASDNNVQLQRFKVAGRKYSGRQKVYSLRTINHREIKATASHPFLAAQKRGKFVYTGWIPLEKLSAGDLVAISGNIPDSGKPHKINFERVLRTKKSLDIPNETTEELMWLFGLYVGDGFMEKARVSFAVPKTDKARPKLENFVKNILKTNYEEKGNIVLRIASANLVKLLKSLGFTGRAQEKRVPAWVYTLPKSQRRAFIDGYVAADGNVRKGHKNISITSCNRKLLEDVKFLAMTCGLNPGKISKWTRTEKKPLGKEEKEYTHYFLYFGDEKLTQPIAFIPVSEIKYFGEEDTWDIEVEGAHNFVANGFIVHNSAITMKYPSVFLIGEGARADILSVAFANSNQIQDTGAKAIHAAPNTSSTILSKSVSKGSGFTNFRGLVQIYKGARNSKSHMKCDALMLDPESKSDTIPTLKIDEKEVQCGHEAVVGKVSEDQLFYLMSRGLTEQQATTMIVSGFLQAFTKSLPLEYAIEFNRLIELEMTGSVG